MDNNYVIQCIASIRFGEYKTHKPAHGIKFLNIIHHAVNEISDMGEEFCFILTLVSLSASSSMMTAPARHFSVNSTPLKHMYSTCLPVPGAPLTSFSGVLSFIDNCIRVVNDDSYQFCFLGDLNFDEI